MCIRDSLRTVTDESFDNLRPQSGRAEQQRQPGDDAFSADPAENTYDSMEDISAGRIQRIQQIPRGVLGHVPADEIDHISAFFKLRFITVVQSSERLSNHLH